MSIPSMASRRSPPGIRSQVAFRWTDNLGRLHVRQAIPLPLDPQRPARSLTIFNAGPGGTLHVSAATMVRTRYADAEARVRVVTDDFGREDQAAIYSLSLGITN